MSLAILFPLLAGIIYGVSALIQKKGSKSESSPIVLSIIYTAVGVIVSFIIALITGISYEFTLLNVIILLLSGALGAFGFLFYFKALKRSSVSIVGMLTRIQIVITTLFGVYLFSEKFLVFQVIGIVLIILGVMLPGIKDIKHITSHGAIYALLTGVFFGLSSTCDKYVSPMFSSGFYNFISFCSMFVFMLGIFFFSGEFRKVRIRDIKLTWDVILPGAINSFAYFLILSAYTSGVGLGLTNLFTQIRMPIIIFGGILLFKEKENNLLKVLGGIAIIVGAVLLKL